MLRHWSQLVPNLSADTRGRDAPHDDDDDDDDDHHHHHHHDHRTRCVADPPEVTGGNVNYTVTAGTTATLVCDVRASPSATAVFWNKDGALIDRTSGRYSGGTVASPSLVISAVVKGDTGYYTCGGTNGIGSTTGDKIYLLVRCE